MWTQALAIFATQSLERNLKQDLFPQQVFQFDAFASVVADGGVLVLNLNFFVATASTPAGRYSKIEVALNRVMHWFQASGAQDLQIRRQLPDYPDIVHLSDGRRALPSASPGRRTSTDRTGGHR